jgi:hypothetical protein
MRSRAPGRSPLRGIRRTQKGWKRCACFIFASGALNGKFRRKYTGKSDWEAARAAAASWEEAQSWDGRAEPEPAPEPVVTPAPARVTIADAAKVFLSHREGAKIAPATLRKYRTFTKQLTTFADARGYVMVDQFTPADIDVFYGGWNLGARAKGKRLGTLRSFFRFCTSRKWLAETPLTPISNRPSARTVSPTKRRSPTRSCSGSLTLATG